MIKDIFDTESIRTDKQNNFLKVISRIPQIKSNMGDSVNQADINIANEANQLLNLSEDAL